MKTTHWTAIAALAIAGCESETTVGGVDGGDIDADVDGDTDTDVDGDTDTDVDGDSDTDTDDDPCDRDYSDPVEPLLINEVYFRLSDDAIELRNDGAAAQSLTRWVLATGPDRVYPFPAGLSVPPGGVVALYWLPNADCDLDSEACGLGGFLHDLNPTGGDLLLLRGDDLDCPDAVVDYARWGDAEAVEKDLSPIATEAGEWPDGDYIDMSTYEAGTSIIHDGTQENGRTHWYTDATPTIGDDNFECRVDEDCFLGLLCIDRTCQ